MSYKALVNSNITRAFALLKDLAIPCEFTKKAGTTFDFSTSAAAHSSTTTVSLKIIVIKDKRSAKERGVITKSFMAKKASIGDLSVYDTVVIEGVTWKVGPILQDTGFVIMASLYKETL